LRQPPKLEAAKLLAAKLEANKQQRARSFRHGVVFQSIEHVVGSFKLSGLELGGFQLWQ